MRRLGLKYLLCAIAIILFCAVRYTVVLQSWTSGSGMGWSFGPLGVARGIKGSGTGLTFDPLITATFRFYKKAKNI